MKWTMLKKEGESFADATEDGFREETEARESEQVTAERTETAAEVEEHREGEQVRESEENEEELTEDREYTTTGVSTDEGEDCMRYDSYMEQIMCMRERIRELIDEVHRYRDAEDSAERMETARDEIANLLAGFSG